MLNLSLTKFIFEALSFKTSTGNAFPLIIPGPSKAPNCFKSAPTKKIEKLKINNNKIESINFFIIPPRVKTFSSYKWSDL